MAKPQPVKVEVDMSTIEAKLQELRDAGREVNLILADVKETLREVRKVKAEVQAIFDGAAPKIEKMMEEAAKKEIDELSAATALQIEKASDAVIARFDKLRDILLGEDEDDDGESVPDLIAQLPTCRRCGKKDTPGGHKCERVVPDAT